MSQILAVRGALPDHKYSQAVLTELFAEVIATEQLDRTLLEKFHANAGVSSRHTALPLEGYAGIEDFGQANDHFLEIAPRLGAQSVSDALAAAGLSARDVDVLISTTITGIAVPSLDARVAPLLGLRPDVKRMPIMGLGCLAGAAGIARLHDYLIGHPTEVAVLLSVELCSLTVQRSDTTVPNMLASGLFGDGAAAVVAVGDQHPLAQAARSAEDASTPSVLASRSQMYADTQRAMGWDVGSTGLRIVLGAEVPSLVQDHVAEDVDAFLRDHELSREDISWWVCHPGGPKVLEALQDALGLSRGDVQVTWDSLDRIGNLSSASVLFVLEDTLRHRPPEPGAFGIIMAMGPGFSLELVLMRA